LVVLPLSISVHEDRIAVSIAKRRTRPRRVLADKPQEYR